MKLHYGWVVVGAGALMGCVAIGTVAIAVAPRAVATETAGRRAA